MAKQKPFKPFIIKTPFPTEKEVAKELKELGFPISSKREIKQVDKILKDILDKDKKEKKRKNKKHTAKPATGTEIRKTLRISKKDREKARKALSK